MVCFALERNLEDHEMVYDVVQRWPSKSDRRLQLRYFAKKYEFFSKPTVSWNFFSVQDFFDAGVLEC